MHADAPDRGEDQDAVLQRGAVAILLEGEGVIAVAPLEAREPRLRAPLDATEERLLGLLQPRQHVLQHMRVDGGVLRECGPHRLQLGFLLEARDGGMALLPGGDALL
jgi:hypothetical protein